MAILDSNILIILSIGWLQAVLVGIQGPTMLVDSPNA